MEKTVLAACQERLLEKRNAEIADAEMKTAEIRSKVAGISEIDARLAKVSSSLFAEASKPDFESRFEIIKKDTDELWNRRAMLLKDAGYDSEYDSPKYSCSVCHDTGYVKYDMCRCLKVMIAEELYRRSGLASALSGCSFDNFNTLLYTGEQLNGKAPRDIMENIKCKCVTYAETFDGKGSNLLFIGATGLGKTHLSAAIGNTIIKKGFTVCYESAHDILEESRANTFSDADNDTNRFIRCDLLIIDDFGAEPKGDFSTSVFTDLIDKRLISSKSTVISTNLNANQIISTYSPRLASRLLTAYTVLTFAGKDIRMVKMVNGIK
jgi:DNA replication protein DnaC